MKLSVSAFRAQASAQRKILSSYQNQLNYGACTSFPALGGFASEGKPQMMVDSTGIGPAGPGKASERSSHSCDSSGTSQEESEGSKTVESKEEEKEPGANPEKREESFSSDKNPGRARSKSNQRWMKLRTTVQLSGAISSTTQKSKPPLKREDSFLKRFSTRQIPETQETVDTGDETETPNGSQTQNEVNRRRRKRRKEMSKTVVNPDENFFFYWLMTVTVCVLYNLWTLIVRQSFPELQKAASAFWYSGDGFTDVVFVCDIVVQFRTGYLEQGLMVYNSKKLATHYLKSRAFILDILSLVPLDFIQLNIGVNPILRFPRFLKIYRVYSYYYIVESRTVYPNLWRVVNLIHILLILAHWFGCFYYLLSEAEGFQGDWVYPYRQGDYATLTRKYLGSLYWSTLTLTTIGDLPTPETNAESRGRSKAMTSAGDPEGIPRRGHKSRLLQFNSNYGYLFTIVSYLIGVFIFATIVGQVGNVITNRNANRLEFERLLDGAKTYMRHHKVPGGMKRRVLRWYDYSWSRGRIQGGGDINTALGLLPDKLKTELALHVNLSVLKKVTIFQECQPEFLHDLVLKMKAYIFTPGDLICRKGEVAREMFIIADGILDVISENGRVLTTMKAGDFFGEIGILNLDGLNKRTADVRSVGYSELFSLSREDVLAAMKDYPEAQEILQSLGRKRLMEAKNASKIFKVQVKQVKDHDSSGDSDTTGKRIVEKLRSDVKGLKNALRRSRRGTRTKEMLEECVEGFGRKTSTQKHSILRRMSHVQSSDEYEGNSEIIHSPIGAGLPLLQRLKLLKEKQDNERDDRNRSKIFVHSGNQTTKDENSETEILGAGIPFTQRLKLLKHKEELVSFGHGVVSSTVRTQLTGVRFNKSLPKAKTLTFPGDPGETTAKEESKASLKVKDSTESERVSLKEKLKLVPGGSVKDKNSPSKTPKDCLAASTSNFGFSQLETSNNVPIPEEAGNSVPESLGNKFEVPISKDGWKLLKKSSLTCSKSERKIKSGEIKPVKKVSEKGTYLSKSDTVLERQETSEKEEERRSRSISSPNDFGVLKKSLKRTVEELIRERRRTRSVTQTTFKNDHENNSNFWEFPEDPTEMGAREEKRKIKKYNSISDLSPEYSGLPFVKKLKILNERQKLAELEKELLVRSASLDVPERSPLTQRNELVRSQSEASTIESKWEKPENFRAEIAAGWKNGTTLQQQKPRTKRPVDESEIAPAFRNFIIPDKWHSSVASPESNETLERRRLKSILKKLSAEENTSDEDPTPRFFAENSAFQKSDNAELRTLMRAPTVEGYAARHKKLTKSVTFDSDTLPSPSDGVSFDSVSEENVEKSFSPMSPTALLTLQLSNLSMIPIASPKKMEKGEGRENGSNKRNSETETVSAKINNMVEDKRQKSEGTEKEAGGLCVPLLIQELAGENSQTTSSFAGETDESPSEVKSGIRGVLRQLLEQVQREWLARVGILQAEIAKRDEVILELQFKIQHLEKSKRKLEKKGITEPAEGHQDGSETDPDLSDTPSLEQGDFVETIRRGGSPAKESSNIFACPEDSSSVENFTRVKEGKTDYFPSRRNSQNLPFDYSGNVIKCEKIRSKFEPKDQPLVVEGKIQHIPDDHANQNTLKRRLGRSHVDSTSDEELELVEAPGSFLSHDCGSKPEKFSVDDTRLDQKTKSHREVKWTEERKRCQIRSSAGHQGADFTRAPTTSQRNQDFVTLDIEDNSNSSDVEISHNNDWEVQMLVKELAKKDSRWQMEAEAEDWTLETEANVGHLKQVKQLQEEVNKLKQMVCETDMTRFTNSELDVLETILEAKDKKISKLGRSNSLKDEEGGVGKIPQTNVCVSVSENKVKPSQQRKKTSLGQKIGQALSFDFHDMESRKRNSPDCSKHRPFCLLRQKTVSHQKRQSLYSLWRTSSMLRNRVLEDPDEINQNMTSRHSDTTTVRSSLPILISSALNFEKTWGMRTSLPTLSAPKELPWNLVERHTSSVSSSEDAHQESDFKQSCDSVFEEEEPHRESIHLEIRNNVNCPSTSGFRKLSNCQPNNGLNSFMKTVGQKVKRVMGGDVNTRRNHVPTISKLCDEQSALNDVESGSAEDFGGLGGTRSEDDSSNIEGEPSVILDTFGGSAKTDSADF